MVNLWCFAESMIEAERLFRDVLCGRGTISLLSHEALASLVGFSGDPHLQGRIVAESIMRCWLFAGDSDGGRIRELFLRAWQDAGFSSPVLDALSVWLHEQSVLRAYTWPVGWMDLAPLPVRELFCERLKNWEEAHGIAVFVLNGSDPHLLASVAMPFIISDLRNGSHGAMVRTAFDEALRDDSNDKTIQLDKAVSRANHLAKELDFLKDQQVKSPIIVLTTLDGLSVAPLEGESLGLAVLLAHFLRSKQMDAPALDLVASGALSLSGCRLATGVSAEVVRAKRRLLEKIGAKRIILPKCEDVSGDGDWPCGQDLREYFGRLVDEGKQLPEVSITSNAQQLRRIQELRAGMKYGSVAAGVAAFELKAILAGSGEWMKSVRRRLTWVEGTLELAAAECHLGNPSEGNRLCDQILSWRSLIGVRIAGFALVRQAVNLTDMAEFAAAVARCREAIDLLPSIGQELERMELELHAHGTLGQALAFWSLQNDEDSSRREESLVVLQRAAELAGDLDLPCEPQGDLPRNLAYVHLWYALHDPVASEPFFQRAREGSDSTSRAYLQRQRWLAAYRAPLLNQQMDWHRFEEELPTVEVAGGWLRVLSLKYRGALRAAEEDWDAAEADFREAVHLISPEGSIPLLVFISATAALQGAESLRDSRQSTAMEMRDLAIQRFEQSEVGLSGSVQGARWLERARGLFSSVQLADLPDPQRFYQY